MSRPPRSSNLAVKGSVNRNANRICTPVWATRNSCSSSAKLRLSRSRSPSVGGDPLSATASDCHRLAPFGWWVNLPFQALTVGRSPFDDGEGVTVNELGRSAAAIVAAPTVLDLRDALTEAVRDLVPGDARWRLSLLASDDLPRLVNLMADGRLVDPRYLPAAVVEELSGLPFVLACPLRCVDRSGAQVLRGALFVAAPSVELLVELEPTLRTLAALAGAALDRLALVAEVERADLDGFFRSLVMRASDVVLILEPDTYRITFASPSAARVFPT